MRNEHADIAVNAWFFSLRICLFVRWISWWNLVEDCILVDAKLWYEFTKRMPYGKVADKSWAETRKIFIYHVLQHTPAPAELTKNNKITYSDMNWYLSNGYTMFTPNTLCFNWSNMIYIFFWIIRRWFECSNVRRAFFLCVCVCACDDRDDCFVLFCMPCMIWNDER